MRASRMHATQNIHALYPIYYDSCPQRPLRGPRHAPAVRGTDVPHAAPPQGPRRPTRQHEEEVVGGTVAAQHSRAEAHHLPRAAAAKRYRANAGALRPHPPARLSSRRLRSPSQRHRPSRTRTWPRSRRPRSPWPRPVPHWDWKPQGAGGHALRAPRAAYGGLRPRKHTLTPLHRAILLSSFIVLHVRIASAPGA
jgi:hypothetical protein